MKTVAANRRQFLLTTAATGVGYWTSAGLVAKASTSPNEQIQLACFGVHGKGKTDLGHSSVYGKPYAFCDVDRLKLDLASRVYKVEEKFTDFRELFDKLGDKIDAVTVSTPDHTHAVIAAMAMKLGKHCFCQKPLTHSIWESRRLGDIAREKGVATQMGNHFTAHTPMRKMAYQIRAGQLGKVNEVHIWTDRPVWPQGGHRPMMKPMPKTLDWQSWLGPAPYRAYGDGYHPFAWRGWWDFGTGALGDMACHTCNLPFMALNMRDPISVEAECPEHDGDSYPGGGCRIVYDFPELDGRPAFKMTWYDGGKLPPAELFSDVTHTTKKGDKEIPAPCPSGVLILGDKAKLYAAGDYAEQGHQYIGGGKELEVEFPVAPKPGGERGHMKEWFDAIANPSKPAVSNFPDYAGPLTETILLGNLAVWKRGRVDWDPANLKPKNDPSLERIVRNEYRSGYEV